MKFEITLTRPATVSWTRTIEAQDIDEAEQIMMDYDMEGDLIEDKEMELEVNYDCEPELFNDDMLIGHQ